MGDIFLLSLAAAVYPALLAAAVVLLALPQPRGLLLGYLIGGMTVSITAGLLILPAFQDSDPVLGSKSTVSPGAYIFAGVLLLAVAWLLGTRRGREVTARRRRPRPEKPQRDKPSWTSRVLSQGSTYVALGVGAVMNLPGPWYLLALRDIADGSYSRPEQIGLIVLFNVVMFTLIEVPLVGYLLQPDQTATRVAAFNDWLGRNARNIVAILALAFAVYAIVSGVVAIVS
jgi:Sap, sulfolipid-1-addressing protein